MKNEYLWSSMLSIWVLTYEFILSLLQLLLKRRPTNPIPTSRLSLAVIEFTTSGSILLRPNSPSSYPEGFALGLVLLLPQPPRGLNHNRKCQTCQEFNSLYFACLLTVHNSSKNIAYSSYSPSSPMLDILWKGFSGGAIGSSQNTSSTKLKASSCC